MSSSKSNQTLGCLAITGPDSARFLQGQCTADAAKLDVNHWTLAGFANVKGRLYANGRLARLAEDHFWFILPLNNLLNTHTQLEKYAAFFKTSLADVSQHWQVRAQSEARGEAYHISQTPTQINLYCSDHWQLSFSTQDADDDDDDDDGQSWQAYEMHQGLVWITPDLIAAFLPQELAWDSLGGISYQKGCFTGQEVIARLHYRGQLKKGLRHLSGFTCAPSVLATLHNAAGQRRAQIARVQAHAHGWNALAVVHHETTDLMWQAQEVTLGDWVAPQSTTSA